MRTAKNRTTIEEHIRSGDADLSLNEATALLMMTSDMRKVLAFARDCENLSGDELIDRCIAEGVGVIVDRSYNMFAGRTEAEVREWHLFAMFLSLDLGAQRPGKEPHGAWCHIEYVLQRPFQNVSEWLGEEGDRFRRVNGYSPWAISSEFKVAWAAFCDEHREWSREQIEEKLKKLQSEFEKAHAEGRFQSKARRKRAPAL
jgi:hypothetical protein